MKVEIIIREAKGEDVKALAYLANQLWPGYSAQEMKSEMSALLEKSDAVCFLAFAEGAAAGFAQCQLRYDYVEGTESSPVGYLEGIYVEESFRGCGIARQLLEKCSSWAREKGCTEFASDCELDNVQSLRFHKSVGFEEANRIICFVRKL